MIRRRAALPGAVLFALSSLARADGDGRALLKWERARGAEGCTSGEELARAVDAHAGRPLLVTTGSADVRVAGRVSPRPLGWHATLEISRRDGGRGSNRVVAVEGRDCRGLDEALVLVIAVAVEPLVPAVAGESPSREENPEDVAAVAGAAPSSERAPEVGAESPPPERDRAPETNLAVAAPVETTADVAPRRSRAHGPTRFRFTGSAAISSGLMPAAAMGFGGAVAWTPSARLSLELGAMGFPFGQSPTNVGRADFRVVYGEARACPALVNTKVSVDACAVLQAGELRAEGDGFAVLDASSSRPYVGWGAALRASVDVAGPFFLRLGLQATVPVVRDSFVVESAGRSVEVHRVAGVVPIAAADVGLGF